MPSWLSFHGWFGPKLPQNGWLPPELPDEAEPKVRFYPPPRPFTFYLAPQLSASTMARLSLNVLASRFSSRRSSLFPRFTFMGGRA